MSARRRPRPRRASKRWLEGAPSFVLSVSDNRGASADRYTVWFEPFWSNVTHAWYVPYLALSGAPTHPQGVSIWGELPQWDAKERGRDRVRWLDLPEHVREHAIARWKYGEQMLLDLEA